MSKACFITVEGIEGAGKSTCLQLIEQRIRARGHDLLLTREPGGTPLGEALRDLFEVRKGQPSIGDIAQMVVDHFGVKLSDLQSKRRTQSIAYPRQMAMYLTRKVTRHSLEEIGAFFGGRDHSTVLYAVEKITKQFQQDAECKGQIETFLARLGV